MSGASSGSRETCGGSFADVRFILRVSSTRAFATASGMVNLITPTSAVVMGGLAIGRVPYERWLRFVWPLLVALTLIIMAALALAVTFGATP